MRPRGTAQLSERAAHHAPGAPPPQAGSTVEQGAVTLALVIGVALRWIALHALMATTYAAWRAFPHFSPLSPPLLSWFFLAASLFPPDPGCLYLIVPALIAA